MLVESTSNRFFFITRLKIIIRRMITKEALIHAAIPIFQTRELYLAHLFLTHLYIFCSYRINHF